MGAHVLETGVPPQTTVHGKKVVQAVIVPPPALPVSYVNPRKLKQKRGGNPRVGSRVVTQALEPEINPFLILRNPQELERERKRAAEERRLFEQQKKDDLIMY